MKIKAPIKESRKSIIEAVRTPLGFFTLGLLIFDGIVLIVSATVESNQRVSLIWVALILVFLTMVLVAVLAYLIPSYLFGVTPSISNSPTLDDSKIAKREITYEVFVASPMAGTATDSQYQETREMTLSVINSLKKECGFHTIYFAGESIAKKKDFEARFFSSKKDFDALKKSRYFVLILPKAILSSVIVEAGYALALGTPSVYFVKDREYLPFMLREAPQVFPNKVLVHEYKSTDDLLNQIEDAKLKLFPPPE